MVGRGEVGSRGLALQRALLIKIHEPYGLDTWRQIFTIGLVSLTRLGNDALPGPAHVTWVTQCVCGYANSAKRVHDARNQSPAKRIVYFQPSSM